MRTHRAHTKSRNGCLTCKGRKIKCDEKRPVCSGCAYRGAECTYRDFVQFVPVNIAPTTTVSTNVLASTSSDGVAQAPPSSDLPLRELFSRIPRSPFPFKGPIITNAALIAHYCRHTSNTLAAVQNSQRRTEVIRHGIPVVGIQHECVSHALAALAAMNLWCDTVNNPNQPHMHQQGNTQHVADTYRDQAEIHYGRCLRLFQDELQCVKSENFNAVLACSALLGICGLAYNQIERRRWRSPGIGSAHLEGESDVYAESVQSDTSPHSAQSPLGQSNWLDLRWIQLFRGVKSVHHTAARHLDRMGDSVILPLIEPNEIDSNPGSPQNAATPIPSSFKTLENEIPNIILGEGPSALSNLRYQIESRLDQGKGFLISRTDGEVCLEALRALQSTVNHIPKPGLPNPRALIVWVSDSSTAFLELLEKHNVVALAIYAHYLVYLVLREDLWWFGDMGTSTIRDILVATGHNTYPVQSLGEAKHDDYFGRWGEFGPNLQSRSDLQSLFAWPARILMLSDEYSGRRP